MKKNMGIVDRSIRLVAAVIIVIFYFANTIPGVFGMLLVVFSMIFIVTSAISICPLYTVLGIDTCLSKKNKEEGEI